MWYSRPLTGLSIVLLSYLLFLWLNTTDNNYCITNIFNNTTSCRPECSHGEFSVHDMRSCVPWLSCNEISTEVEIGEIIGKGAVKIVKKGQWKNYPVVINELSNTDYIHDFQDGLKNVIEFQPDTRVVQLVGFCKTSNIYLTEYYSFKSADHFISQKHRLVESLTIRFKLCLEYIEIIAFLHTHRNGSYVMCDSNDPWKALSQVLVREDLSLVLNDADALPIADRSVNTLVKCGHKELFGDFVAPEQLWPYENDYVDSLMPHYDEKTDIWKIPDVCKVLIDSMPGSTGLMLRLFDVNARCKNENPSDRPDVVRVLEEYRTAFKDLVNKPQ